MGFLSKIFGSSSQTPEHSPPSTKISEPMAEDQFWAIVQSSLDESGGDLECQENCLVNSLERLTPEEMIGFRLRTDKLLHDSYKSEMWCAGYLINGGCSDDGFEYFRLWLISKGKIVFEDANRNPDSLIDHIDENLGQDFEFESFWYVALTAFENTTKHQLYDYIDYDNVPFGEGKYPQFDFTWEEDNPESMERVCPRLFQKFADE